MLVLYNSSESDKMIKILAFLATLLVANAVPVLESNITLTEQENYLISKSTVRFALLFLLPEINTNLLHSETNFHASLCYV